MAVLGLNHGDFKTGVWFHFSFYYFLSPPPHPQFCETESHCLAQALLEWIDLCVGVTVIGHHTLLEIAPIVLAKDAPTNLSFLVVHISSKISIMCEEHVSAGDGFS